MASSLVCISDFETLASVTTVITSVCRMGIFSLLWGVSLLGPWYFQLENVWTVVWLKQGPFHWYSNSLAAESQHLQHLYKNLWTYSVHVNIIVRREKWRGEDTLFTCTIPINILMKNTVIWDLMLWSRLHLFQKNFFKHLPDYMMPYPRRQCSPQPPL
jgi:hypothetical protein